MAEDSRTDVFMVPVSGTFLARLSEEWSEPVQVKIVEDEMIFRSLDKVELSDGQEAFLISELQA